MARNVTRRTFLNTAAAGAGAAGLSTLPWARDAFAQKTTLIGVTWGGPWLEGTKAVASRFQKYDVKWELHTGGSAAIVPKIKAAWPNPPYDFVAHGDPQYPAWIVENWPEPMTYEEMPNLKAVPDEYLYKNDKGQILNVPISVSAAFFGYRKDLAPFPIQKMEDLLDPRLKGKLCLRDATQGMNDSMVHYAAAFGGDKTNLEPGWEFLKKLAKSGNVARFYKSETDFINSLTTGEAVAGFANIGNWGKVAEQFPVEFLIKDKKQAPGFQAGVRQEGFMILTTSPRKKEAKEFLNFFVSEESNAIYNKPLNMAPVNPKSEATVLAKRISFADKADREKLVLQYDWKHLNATREENVRRFEKEIVPLAR